MKKVFLLLASAFMGVAAFAGNEWDEVGGKIAIAYNSYGTAGADGSSVQWQAGNTAALSDAVAETGNTAWTPAVGESFMITLNGTANFTGTVQVFIVDERAEAGFWADLVGTCGEFKVEAGKAFESTTVLQISTIMKEDVELTAPGLIFGIIGGKEGDVAYAPTNEGGVAFDPTEDCEFTVSTYEVLYEKAADYESPIALTFKGAATNEEDGYNYQYSAAAVGVTAAKAAQYVNLELAGVAVQDIATLMYSLVDGSEKAGWWFQMTDEMATIAANIKKDQKVDIKCSIELTKETPAGSDAAFQNVLMAMDQQKAMNLYFKNATIKATVTDSPKYSAPNPLAVEEVSAVAIENGVVYSAGQIVVYNAAGQVVATASQEFAIASLEAGVYFVATAEGTAKIVK